MRRLRFVLAAGLSGALALGGCELLVTIDRTREHAGDAGGGDGGPLDATPQPPGVKFAQRYGDLDADFSTESAVDKDGNVLVVGEFVTHIEFGHAGIDAVGQYDGFVTKLRPDGSEVWSRALGGDANDQAWGVATDETGAVYVVGDFHGTANFGNGSIQVVNAGGQANAFIVKLDANGDTVWATPLGGATDDTFGFGIAVDAAHDVYLSGLTHAGFAVGSTQVTVTNGFVPFAAKLSPEGVPQWVKGFATDDAATAFTIAVDDGGHVLVGGIVGDGGFDLGSGPVHPGSSGTSCFLVGLDGAGTVLWSDLFEGTTTCEARKIVAIPGGDFYVTGNFEGRIDFGSGHRADTGGGTNVDGFLARYHGADGKNVWVTSFGSPAGDLMHGDSGVQLAVEAAGTVVVTGIFNGTASFGAQSVTSNGGQDVFVARYGEGGAIRKVTSFGGAGDDGGLGDRDGGVGVAALAGGRLMLTGDFPGTITFDPMHTLTAMGPRDVYVVVLEL